MKSNSADHTGITSLDRLEPGCRSRIIGIRAFGSLRKRMLAMGMVPGAEVDVIRAAPLGDPVEYRVKGYCLSLRRAEAGLVEVALEGAMMESVCPLVFLAPGTVARVAGFRAGKGLQTRLFGMGFCADVRVKIVSADRGFSHRLGWRCPLRPLKGSGYEGHGEGHRGVCMKREIRIALIGNPNIGKTTIFKCSPV